MDRRTLGRLREIPRRDALALAALGSLLVLGVAALAAPVVSGYDPLAVEYASALQAPSAAHVLGTDNFGRDVLTRLLYGGRTSLAMAVIATTVVVTISVLVGSFAGFFGGWTDIAISRVIDVVLAFPGLVLAIAIASLMGASGLSLVVAITAVSWTGYARIFRSSVLQVKQEEYVAAARCAGTPSWKLLGTHVLGAVAGPILALAALDIGHIILGIASLSFLGLGFTPPTPEWGAMLSEARPFIERAPWVFLAPGTVILLVVLSANYLGDAVRDALDPRAPRIPDIHGIRTLFSRDTPLALEARQCRTTRIETLSRDRVGDGVPEHPIVVETDRLCVDVSVDRERASESRSGTRSIVRNVSFVLRAGECVGVMGESGSGKTTVAAALMGLLRPPLAASGVIRLFGEDVGPWTWNDWRPVRGRHVALINQDPLNALNPILKIGDQLGECVRCHHRISRQQVRERVDEMLNRVQLPVGTASEYPHQLSGGMRQRVAIAMALINGPQLIIADEPTTALDVSTQARILEELATLQRASGAAMVFISHDLRLVARMAERVIVMKDGEVVEQGSTQTVFQSPQHPHTALLLASLPGRAARAKSQIAALQTTNAHQ